MPPKKKKAAKKEAAAPAAASSAPGTDVASKATDNSAMQYIVMAECVPRVVVCRPGVSRRPAARHSPVPVRPPPA